MSKGELTRQRIIVQAAPIFNRAGYAGASMQDIMEATGLEKGGLYRHFSSKEELAAESLRYALSNSIKLRTDNLDHVSGSIAKLRYVAERFVKIPSTIAGGCPLLNAAVDSDDGCPALRKIAHETIADWKSRLIAIVDEGKRAGEIRRAVQSRRVANAIISTLEGAQMISRLEGSREAMHDAVDTLNVLFDDLQPARKPR